MSGGGQVAGQAANPNLPQQSGMQGLPAAPQVQASTGPYQGAAVQQQVANQIGAAAPPPQAMGAPATFGPGASVNPNLAAFQQMLGTMQNAQHPAAPQMAAYQGGNGPITPQMNAAQLNALAAQIQSQFNQQVGSQQPMPQPQPAAAAAAPAASAAAPLNMATSSTTGYTGTPGSVQPQAQYLAAAAKANAPINLVSNPGILTQQQAMQLSSNPAVMAAEAQNASSPTITVPWNGNSYIIQNSGYAPPNGGSGGGQ